jgi:hypothetical protein
MMLGIGGTLQADGPLPSEGGSLFTDVPDNHWSIASLQFLVERGIIEGTPNGQFQGDRQPNRYEVAAMLSRLGNYFETINVSGTTTEAVSSIRPEDLQVLQDLIFKISDRVQELSTDVDGIQATRPVIDDNLTTRILNLESQADEIEYLKAQLTQNEQTIRDLKGQFTDYQINDSTVSEADMTKTNQKIIANRIIGLFALAAGIVGIGLLTLR